MKISLNQKNSHRYLLFAILLIISISGILGEKIPVNNGTGWDGKHYAHLTIHFEELVTSKQIDSYQYQRILTPCIIYYSCKIIHFPLSTSNIVTVFSIYNILLILLSALLYFNLCFKFNLSIANEIIGFAGLFLNYFILKNTPYYPVLTDVSAFFAGMCLTYFFLTNNNVGLLITTLIGFVIFPLFTLSAIVLWLNIRNNQFSQQLSSVNAYRYLAVLISLLFCLGVGYILLYPAFLLPQYKMQLNILLLPISIICILLYLWKSITPFEKLNLINNKTNWKTVSLKIIGISLFILFAQLLINQNSIPEENFTPSVFITNVLQQSIRNPFVSMVSHTIYLGPAVLLILFYYKRLLQTITSLGDSAIAYFLILIVLAIGSETRQFIHFYPFVILTLLITLQSVTFSIKQAWLFVLLSIGVSKCWFTINVQSIFSQYDYFNFPDQRYFMSQGPFMSDMSYAINLVICIITGALIYLVGKQTKKDSTSS